MKKTIVILLAIGCMIALSWCAKKYTTEIAFDQFDFEVKTLNTGLEAATEEQKTIFADEENLYKVYMMTNTSGYSDSILISKENSSTQIPLERVMQLNMNKLSNRLQWFKTSAPSQIDIECWEDILTWYLQSFTFNGITPKTKISMNQYFFKDQDRLYIISSSTENSSDSKGFKTGIKDITCTK